MSKDSDYENSNIVYDDQYPDGGIKCKNYELCEDVLPKWWFECKGNYLCTNCDTMFGRAMPTCGIVECIVCLDENKRGISQPNCNHVMCIDCAKRCHYGDRDFANEPKFPYPDIVDEYDDDSDNPMWETDYPLIKIYNEEHNKWDDKRDDKYAREEYLRNCPLCRR
jgi:hypothetical protein